MKYIGQFTEGTRIADVYLCKHHQVATNRNGKEYASITLQDKSGTVDGKIWDLNSPGIQEFDVMDYVYVEGEVTLYQGNFQINIRRIRVARDNEYTPADYLPVSTKGLKEMYQELKGLVLSIREPHLRALAERYYIEDKAFLKKFCYHSAAKSVHHGFVGGLMEHTLSVMKLCDYIAESYPVVDRDLLVTAALFHDIGKVTELSAFPENDYTDAGQLLGHIYIGAQMVEKAASEIEGFPEKLARELVHCILAHHGELEYGSPKKPALIEALALSMADNLDAKMETMKEALDNGGPGTGREGWLGFNRYLESNIRRTGGSAESEKAGAAKRPADAGDKGKKPAGRGEDDGSRFSNRINISGLNLGN